MKRKSRERSPQFFHEFCRLIPWTLVGNFGMSLVVVGTMKLTLHGGHRSKFHWAGGVGIAQW